MVAKKRKSKRQSLQQKYKIIKRTKEHHKRVKKGVLVSTGKKKTTDNHIPNAWPYKEELLKEIQQAKDKMEDVRLRQKEKRHEELVSVIIFAWNHLLFLYFLSVQETKRIEFRHGCGRRQTKERVVSPRS